MIKRMLLPALLFAIVVGLSACGSAAQTPATGAEGVNANAPMPESVVDTSYATYTGEIGVLDATTTVVSHPAQPVGTTAASQITQGNPPCPGFIETTPTYIFDLKSDADLLSVYFEGKLDSTVMVITPQEQIECNDNDEAAGNLNPVVKLEKPAQGRYGVFVGRINMQQDLDGKVYATTDPNPPVNKLAP
jgi:hypothetical protein